MNTAVEYFRDQAQLGDQAIKWATQNVRNFTQFQQWAEQNWSLLVRRGAWYAHSDSSSPELSELLTPLMHSPAPRLNSFKIVWTFCGLIPNSHCAPVNQPTNFHRHEHMPKYFHGWRLSTIIDHSYTTEWHPAVFNQWTRSVIHTGYGGNEHRLRRELTLWANDWPAWQQQQQKDQVWEILAT